MDAQIFQSRVIQVNTDGSILLETRTATGEQGKPVELQAKPFCQLAGRCIRVLREGSTIGIDPASCMEIPTYCKGLTPHTIDYCPAVETFDEVKAVNEDEVSAQSQADLVDCAANLRMAFSPAEFAFDDSEEV